MSDHDPNGDDDFLTKPTLRGNDFPDNSFSEGYAAGKREAKTEIESLKDQIKKLEKEVEKLKKK